MSSDPVHSDFDGYAENYEEALEKGISVSGENKEYFAKGRVDWLGDRLDLMGYRPVSILDYGCGTGTATPFLLERFRGASVLGVDVSERSLAVARKEHGISQASFALISDRAPSGDIDLAFCNGVFHHIPPADRAACMKYVYDSLVPGGMFAMWENNPWNIGTQIVMARIPFDREAVKISPPQARRLMRAAGFEVVRTDALFVFPSFLRFLRWTERYLARFPIGAQYMVLGRKP